MTVVSLGQVDLAEMDPEERARLINCLPGYKPGMLVGTCGADNQSNLAIISSHFHLGSRPPLLAMILRPDTGNSERHTLSNILDTQCWTLNAFTLEQSAQAHQTSAPNRAPTCGRQDKATKTAGPASDAQATGTTTTTSRNA